MGLADYYTPFIKKLNRKGICEWNRFQDKQLAAFYPAPGWGQGRGSGRFESEVRQRTPRRDPVRCGESGTDRGNFIGVESSRLAMRLTSRPRAPGGVSGGSWTGLSIFILIKISLTMGFDSPLPETSAIDAAPFGEMALCAAEELSPHSYFFSAPRKQSPDGLSSAGRLLPCQKTAQRTGGRG